MSAGARSITGAWVGDRPAATPAFLVAVSGAAFLAAAVLPSSRPGLGLAAVGVAGALAVAVGRRRRLDRSIVLWGALSVALVSMAAVRAAPWVIGVDILFALLVAAVAVAGEGRWRDLLQAPVIVTVKAVEAIPFVGRGLGRASGGVRRIPAVLRGGALAIALLLVFGTLFASADGVFARLVGDVVLPDIDLAEAAGRIIVFTAVLVTASALTLAAPWRGSEPAPTSRNLSRTEWGIALGAVNLLFASFLIVQLTVLFGGQRHVLETAGLTYAEYARQGFFQLVVVAVLTLLVVGGAVRWARRREPRDVLLQILLGLLCVLALVVLFSALRRLLVYEEAFGFTQLRISVHATILWLAGLLVLVLVAGIRMRGSWLPRAAVAFTGVALLAFSLLDPEALVASKNVQRFQETGEIDVAYLSTLGEDAVPALAELPAPLRDCVLADPLTGRPRLEGPDGWGEWSYGRARAEDMLSRLYPAGSSAPACPAVIP
jgi:uncharacterized protein DUF4153